ncbi:hypothetical protein [Desulfoferrobacter suflitae]|uniref:hypothetical protein n=1 Tax=Desulfoferrobacter suflitae TaxID=2865782 RepID=UPI002164C6CD|nr:hypothetical protein [Desulfoferrobacter suflitae]MCK8600465.1 hypothetical protein [Desulfoferrobacter suflitae]
MVQLWARRIGMLILAGIPAIIGGNWFGRLFQIGMPSSLGKFFSCWSGFDFNSRTKEIAGSHDEDRKTIAGGTFKAERLNGFDYGGLK